MTGVSVSAAIPSGIAIKDEFSATQEFLSLFPRRDCFIWKLFSEKNWRKSKGQLHDHQIIGVISDGGRGLYRGCYWGEQTRFAVLDIDAGSNYNNAQELKQLRQRLASIGLSGNVLFQSSDSGGWHLYVSFNNQAPSKDVEQTLKAWLKSLGYDLRGGQLEVFPCGNGLRLPLQPGFAWLDEDAKVICSRGDLSSEAALSRFMFDMKSAANDWNYAKTQINSHLNAVAAAAAKNAQERQERLEMSGFEQLFPAGRIAETWEKGRSWWQEGLASKGERHDAVLAVGHYLWYGDSENGITALPGAHHDEYRARLIEHWLTEKHNGFCRHIDQNKWEEIKAQIKRSVLWRGDGQAKEYEPYRLTDRLLKRLLAIFRKTGKVWTVDEFKQANDDRQEEARCKIRAAVTQCLEEGRQISRSTLQALTGCSPNTIKKHADIWKLFALGSGEYNRGGCGGLGALLLVPSGSEPSDEILEPVASQCSDPFLEIESCSENSEENLLELAAVISEPAFVSNVHWLPVCSHVLDGSWRRRGTATGRQESGVLASPLHRQPSTWIKQTGCTCGLNGCPPRFAEPTPGPPHLNPRKFFHKGSGLVLLQEGGRSRAPPR